MHGHGERLQIRAAMVIHHALGFAGGAAGVVDGEQAALVGDGRGVGRGIGEKLFVFVLLLRAIARANEFERVLHVGGNGGSWRN